MRELVAAADHESVKGIARIQLRRAVPVEARLGGMRSGGNQVGGKSAIVTHRGGGGIVLGRDELHFLELQAQIVQRFLDQVRVFVSDVAELRRGHAHEKDGPGGVAVLGGLQPGVIGMPVDLFFQRVQNAQPRIGREAWAWNRHKIIFRGAAARSAPGIRTCAANNAFIFQQQKSLDCWPFALGQENFCKLDQSGILAQNFSVCGNLVRGLFSLL